MTMKYYLKEQSDFDLVVVIVDCSQVERDTKHER